MTGREEISDEVHLRGLVEHEIDPGNLGLAPEPKSVLGRKGG
ncbi:MAG TPA: hypothetical protein VE129_15010 [Thermoanaerobaculia bacterium]|nr:hypothetical protein [Thermoanaerobaculia bacterium]